MFIEFLSRCATGPLLRHLDFGSSLNLSFRRQRPTGMLAGFLVLLLLSMYERLTFEAIEGSFRYYCDPLFLL